VPDHQFIIAVLACLFVPAFAMAALDIQHQLQIDLGEDTINGLAHLQVQDGDTQVDTIGSRSCRRNVDAATDLHFYFAIDDQAVFAGSNPVVEITVEYFDTGEGSIGLQYDSSDTAQFPDDIYKLAGSISLSNTNQWKSHTFEIGDAYLANRQNGGADFRLVKPGGGYFYIDRVTVSVYGESQTSQLAWVLGSTHASGKYYFDPSRDYLNEGAVELASGGMRVIKLWFTPNDPSRYYMWNSDWPSSFADLKALAEHPYWREVFRRPFDTYVLTIFEHRNFHNGFPDPGPAELEQEFYDLARYLLETYRGTGKTFILGHHEGDWHLRGTTDLSTQCDPDQTAINGMIRWYNARQAGVTRARQDVPPEGVHVYGAAEVNLVELAMQGRPTITNDVLPHTNMDLVSYSAYDTVIPAKDDPDAARIKFREALNYLAQKMPDSSTLDPHGEPFGNANVFVSEYGAPEQEWQPNGSIQQLRVTQVTVEEAYAFGCPWIIYWELFCNECCAPGDDPCLPVGGPNPGADPATELEHCRGFWLRRVDGTYSPGWYYLTGQVGSWLKPVSDFNATQTKSNVVRLTWATAPDAGSYRIERSVNGSAYVTLSTPVLGETVYEDDSVQPGQSYRYRLRCEKSGMTPTPWFYSQQIRPTPGDFNVDGKVDQQDFERFINCGTGPNVDYDPQNLPSGCDLPVDNSGVLPADFDRDGDVDQVDFSVFQKCFSGYLKADPQCANDNK
jgi:hypothetical protein